MSKANKQQVPKIRFTGFSEDLVSMEFREFTKLSQGLQISIDKRFLEPGDSRVFYITNEFLNPNSEKKFYIENPPKSVIANEEDILMTRTGNTGKVVTNVSGAYHNNFFKIAYDKTVDKDYLFYLLNEPRIQSEILARAGSSTIPDLNHSDFYSLKGMYPNKKEQTQIGNFFQQIDKLIELQTRAVESAETYKKAMLQKMFPQKGERVPSVRFAGFSGDWELVELGEVVKIKTGKLDANAMKEDGKYDFYTSGIQKYKIDIPAFEGPAITIAGNGATVGFMHYADGLFNAYQRTYVLTEFKGIRNFLYPMIGKELPIKIHQEARTGSIPYIVMDMLTELMIYFPSFEEQTQIGNFFQKLDQNIESEKKKLEQYQTMKRAMLQRMFV